MSKSDKLRIPEYLRHILEAIQRIERYTEPGRVGTSLCPRGQLFRISVLTAMSSSISGQ